MLCVDTCEINDVDKRLGTYLKATVLILFIPICISYINYRVLRIDNSNGRAFHDTLVKIVEAETAFNMAKITPFKWDEMFVIMPYTSQKKMHGIVGRKWTTVNSYFGYLAEKYVLGEFQLSADEIHKLVFLKDGKVVLDMDVMREDADFTRNMDVIASKDADFIIDKSHKYQSIVICTNN